MLNNFFDTFQNIIDTKGEISPFLFLYKNSEIFHAELEGEIQNLLKNNNTDLQSMFTLSDTWENLKIDEVKKFLAQWDIRPRHAFQVFIIENISRMTTQAQNACLKFFEEPGEGNIIFLTNHAEAGILETILSRVQVHDMRSAWWSIKNEFFFSLIENHVSSASDELVRYFFSGKYEKQEYIDFLKTLISYISSPHPNPLPWGRGDELQRFLDELEEDMGWILKNNLQAKYIVDKYIMKLGG